MDVEEMWKRYGIVKTYCRVHPAAAAAAAAA
jgi:hypothetical protein